MHLIQTSSGSNVTADWLTSRTFTFRTEPVAGTISETFTFHRNGFIVGYSHDNERFWDIDGDAVRILDQYGNATCTLKRRASVQGKIELAGPFCNPAAEYEPTAVLHVLEENDSDYHARIQSFDLFDTLVARRCYEPLAVFRSLEIRSGIANFAERRHAVEMSIFGRRAYGIDDIYDLLVAEAFLTRKQANVIRLMELEEEWANLFPIAELVANVNPNDIIISDMYLPRTFVQRVLKEKCGLDNTLYLTNYGKHLRQIWPHILAKYTVRSHFGDNLHADIVGPSQFGIQPMFVTISKWNKAEEILHAAGLADYAHALRETRLQTFHRNPQIANVLKAQVTVNIPLMLLSSFWIRQRAEHFATDKILTAARDCNLWHEMLTSAHFARCGMPPADYIKISRTLCYEDSEPFEAYLRSHFGRRNLLVDMVGTGKSMTALLGHSDLGDRIQACVLMATPGFENHAPSIDAFLTKEFFEYRIFIEALNASADGSAAAAVSDQLGTRILTQPNEFSEFMRQIIEESRRVFEDFMVRLDRFPPPGEIPSLEILHAAADAIVEQLPEQARALDVLFEEQRSRLTRSSIANVVNG